MCADISENMLMLDQIVALTSANAASIVVICYLYSKDGDAINPMITLNNRRKIRQMQVKRLKAQHGVLWSQNGRKISKPTPGKFFFERVKDLSAWFPDSHTYQWN